MFSISANHLLIFAAIATALCWTPLVIQRLALSGGNQRQFVLAPLLLALAAFVPAAATLSATTRASYPGSTTTSLSLALIGLYVLGAAALFFMYPRVVERSQPNRSILVLLLLYWVIGAVANYYAALPQGRLSFFLVPLVVIAAWKLRPQYRGAVAILTYSTIAICIACLILAAVEPSVTFIGGEPTRSATFLFSHRLAGIFEAPDELGFYAAVGLLLSWQWGGWTRRFGLPVCGLALVASDTRSGWFAAAAAFCILLAGARYTAGRMRGRPTLRLLLGGGLVVLAAWGISSYLVPEAELNGFTGRTAIWHFVLQNWRGSPIIGHGPSIWTKLIAAGQVPAYVGEAHNQFFQTLYTMGIVGVILLVALLWVWTVKSVRAAREGYRLPLALEALIVAYGIFASPLSPWAIEADTWLLSIVLFLDPVNDRRAKVRRV